MHTIVTNIVALAILWNLGGVITRKCGIASSRKRITECFFIIKMNSSTIHYVSRSEEFHFGDSLNLVQYENQSTLDQIELNIGKLGPGKTSSLRG